MERVVTRGCRECFHLEVGAGEVGEVVLDVSVIKGGLLDVLVEVTDPEGTKLLSRMYFEGKGESKVPFVAEKPGDYELCFNNEMARWTSKMVAFKAIIKTRAANADAVKPEDLSTLDSKLSTLETTLLSIMDEQQHFKDREAAHSSMLASTHNRITYYSVFESAVLVALSLLQIYLVRKWFDSPTTGATSRSFV